MKIYASQGAIVINDGANLFSINPSGVAFSKSADVYYVYDSRADVQYSLGVLANIENENGDHFLTHAAVMYYFNSLVNFTFSSSSTPQSIRIGDVTGNDALVSTFGDLIVGTRVPSITWQFFYPMIIGNSNSKADDATITALNGGTATFSGGELVLQTSATANGAITIQSNDYVRYLPGHEMYLLFTYVFHEPTDNSVQEFGLNDSQNGFFLRRTKVGLFFVRRKNGVDVPLQIDMGAVFADGSYDPKKFNIYYLRYGYLGVAPAKLSIVKQSGGFANMKTIEYPNMYDTIHTGQTYLPIRSYNTNGGDLVNIIGKAGSVSSGIVNGGHTYPATRYIPFDFPTSTVPIGTTQLGTFRNKLLFGTLENRIKTQLLDIGAASKSSKNVKIYIKKNCTLAAGATWVNVDTNDSVMEYSTNAVATLTTGTLMCMIPLAETATFSKVVKDLFYTLRAGEWATIYVVATASAEIDFNMRWEEQF